MVSVLMTAYKGEFYIEEALRSVLSQLSFEDEIIVCEEKPGSAAGRIVRRLAAEDSRIIPVEGKNAGTVDSMITAIRHSRGDKIYICSQSDVWLPDKIKRVNELFEKGADLVLHNAYITDENLNITEYSYFEHCGVKKGAASNIFFNSFNGSLMAFDRKMLKFIMPIPKHIPLYDQWIGIICRIYGSVKLLDAPLIYHRQTEKKEELSAKERKINRRYLVNRLYKRMFFRR